MQTCPVFRGLDHFHHSSDFQRFQRALLLSLVFICSALPLSAQWSVGVQAGANFSYLSALPTDDPLMPPCIQQFAPRFMIGVILEKELFEQWSAQTGINFTQRYLECSRDEVFTTTHFAVPLVINWRSTKYECLYIHRFETGGEVRSGLGTYYNFYNMRRPHQGLDGRKPFWVYHLSKDEQR
jgi:Integrase core domain